MTAPAPGAPVAAAAAVPARVRRYEATDAPGIARLNARLAAGGSEHCVYPEDDFHRDGSEDGTEGLRERLFVVAQGDEIRAGCFLREQPFRAGGEVTSIGWTKYPVAESLVDRAHAGVPGSLLFGLLRAQPRLMALGMGGHDSAYAKLLGALRFTGSSIPFYVRVHNASRVLRELPHLQRTPARRAAAAVLGPTGLGGLALGALRVARQVRGPRRPSGYVTRVEPAFDTWADDVWRRSADAYGALAVRTSRVLHRLYDAGRFEGASRLRVEHGGRVVGWAVTQRVDMRALEHGPYGRIVLGVLADVIAPPEHAAGVALAATRHLLHEGADLLISNQAHPAWRAAVLGSGFLEAPSSVAFYRSPEMERRLAPVLAADGLHLTRGDGDGLMRV